MKATQKDLTPERVRERLSYDPETGLIRWRVSPNWRVNAGDLTGIPDKDGYLLVTVDGKKRKAHRLAWAIYYGVWPSGEIDHINNVKSDNRIVNMRDVSASINMQNIMSPTSRSKTGVLGVVAVGTKFKSSITTCLGTKHIGTFKTPAEAHAAYLNVKRAVHPGCTF